jgi:hypothetical protein
MDLQEFQSIMTQIEWAMANVEWDLRHWEVELEAAQRAWVLDAAIDDEMDLLDITIFWHDPKGFEELTKDYAEVMMSMRNDNADIVPLAWYQDGERIEIGTARVDPKTGIVTARVDRHIHGVTDVSPDSYSISIPNLDRMEAQLKPQAAVPTWVLDEFLQDERPFFRDDAMNRRCSRCEHLVRQCICEKEG